MAFIDEIVDVTITRDSIGLSIVDLSTLLIIGNTKATGGNEFRVKPYTSLSLVAADYAAGTPEYKAASVAFGQEVRPKKILIGQKLQADGGDDKWLVAYNAIININNDFYGVVLLNKTEANVLAIAEAVEADDKLFGVSTESAEALLDNDDASIIKKLFDLKRLRTFSFYSKVNGVANNNPIEAAVFGLLLSKPAGSMTVAHKTLSGITADNLSADARKSLLAKNGNFYINVAQLSKTFNGKTTSGEWIDVVYGLDWLKVNLKISVFNALSTVDKIPYTNDGIAIIESAVRGILRQAVEMGILDPEGIVITVPNVRDIHKETRASRVLPDVKFEARLAGAIHIVNIRGTISV